MDAKLIKKLRELTQGGILDCKKALEASGGDLDKAMVWLKENGLVKAAKKTDRIATEGLTLARENGQYGVILEVNSETDFVAKNENFTTLINDIADSLLIHRPKDLAAALDMSLPTGTNLKTALLEATATIGEKIELRRFTLIPKAPNHTLVFYNHSNKRVSVLLDFEGTMAQADAYNVAMHVAAMAPQYISVNEIPESFKDAELEVIKAQIADDEKIKTKPANVQAGIIQGKLSKRLAEVTLLDQTFVVDENYKVADLLKKHNVTLTEMIRYELGEGIEKVVTNFATEVAAQINGGK